MALLLDSIRDFKWGSSTEVVEFLCRRDEIRSGKAIEMAIDVGNGDCFEALSDSALLVDPWDRKVKELVAMQNQEFRNLVRANIRIMNSLRRHGFKAAMVSAALKTLDLVPKFIWRFKGIKENQKLAKIQFRFNRLKLA
ncbi:hypothetical protein HDU97_007946 [Phlyctochytrium planicorne]|nr:hypothetical protein HDU97_007946 [Phlyctochytrium planicorne]